MLAQVLSAICLASSVVGQTTHTVTVGDAGSFYDPPSVAAGLNDIVNFVFTGLRPHSVTQSSFENPCSPLAGGFNSGFTSLSNSTDTTEAPVWQLTVTDISAPIWYYCAVTRPVSHCGAGMVGVINPPSQDQFNAFVAAAKNSSTTITSALPYQATGIGASAPQTIVLSSVGPEFLTAMQTQSSSSSTPVSSSSSSTTSSSSTANENRNKSSNTGAIIGGAVGGAVGLGLLVLVGTYLCLRHRRDRPRAPSQLFFSDHRSFSERAMSEHKPDDVTPTISAFPSPPRRLEQMGRRHPEEHGMYNQPLYSADRSTFYTIYNPDDSANSGYFNPSGQTRPLSHPASDTPEATQNMGVKDVSALAKEVAAVLMHQKNPVSMGVNNARGDHPVHAQGVMQSEEGGDRDSLGPPRYQAN